jgi:uncharacterized membrane protein YhaH (DUF805 family)
VSGPSGVLRRRYQRLLAVYPSEWRAANQTVVLDTLLEAAGPTRRWPSPRETLALLAGGVGAWIRRRPDPDDRPRQWLEGLQLGGILLALGAVAVAGGPLVSWLGHGLRDVSGERPAYDGAAAAFNAVWLVLAAASLVSLLRARVRVALVATAAWVPGFVLAQWAFPGASQSTGVRNPAMLAVGAVLLALPLLAILAVLVRRGGARPRSWAWLLLPAALTISYGWAPLVWLLAAVVMVVGLVAALVLAGVTGEVRPAVALAVPCVPPMLGMVLATPLSAALVVTGLAAWGAVRTRQRRGPGRPAGGPAPQNDA